MTSKQTAMNDEPGISIRIEPQLAGYRTFFDERWAQAIRELARGTRLDEPVVSLSLNWRAAANTCAMPWLIVHMLKGEWQAFLDNQQPFSTRMTEALGQRLADAMGDALSHAKRRKLAEAVDRLGQEVDDQPQASAAHFDLQTVWHTLLADAEFQLALWGSQRIGYGAIYHSYENFVRQTIGLALNRPTYRGQKIRMLIRDATHSFGKRLADDLLASRQVRVARLVRNALAHGGGKETEQLKAFSHDLVIESGNLQILASDTRALFDLLKRRAYRLVKAAVRLPSIRGD